MEEQRTDAPILVKICGIRRPEDVDYINEVKPDYAGFILAEGYRRTVTTAEAKRLRQQMDPEISTVGVFVNSPLTLIRDVLEQQIISLVQLHGQEDEVYIRSLRQFCDVPIIKVFAVRDAKDLEKARDSSADYVLLDNKVPGSGQTFDWSVLENVGRPYFLAGGLSCENVGEAIRLQPMALDVSSGVETEGVKDPEKMRRFVELVRESGRQRST